MKARGMFISTLLVIDTFLGAFCYGFNTSAILVIDPKLPAVVPPAPAAPPAGISDRNEDKAKRPAAAGKKVLPTPLPKGALKTGGKSQVKTGTKSGAKPTAKPDTKTNTKSEMKSKQTSRIKATSKNTASSQASK